MYSVGTCSTFMSDDRGLVLSSGGPLPLDTFSWKGGWGLHCVVLIGFQIYYLPSRRVVIHVQGIPPGKVTSTVLFYRPMSGLSTVCFKIKDHGLIIGFS